nr:hypothetical protein [Tanacetum cinerariifolium]
RDRAHDPGLRAPSVADASRSVDRRARVPPGSADQPAAGASGQRPPADSVAGQRPVSRGYGLGPTASGCASVDGDYRADGIS